MPGISLILIYVFLTATSQDVHAQRQIWCPALADPASGKVLSSDRRIGSIAVYKCDRYYKLVGDSQRICLPDGVWSGDSPVCEKITCKAPGKFPNGRIIGKTSTVYNASDVIIFRCNDAVTYVTSKCLEDGEWNYPPPICPGRNPRELRCGNHEYRCWSGEQCILKTYVCDGEVDCTDESDEFGCGRETEQPLDDILATEVSSYLDVESPKRQNPDGHSNAWPNLNPPRFRCRNDESRCWSGEQCIPKRFVCDGEEDCPDKSDEIGCGRETEQPFDDTLVTEVSSSVDMESPKRQYPDAHNNLDCFCIYDYENSFVKAQVRQRILKKGDTIMRGETVSFECKYVSTVLAWNNGLRYFGRVTMTCNSCEKWQSQDLPTCKPSAKIDAVMGQEKDLAISTGGTVQLQKGESRQFFCSNVFLQPQWIYEEKEGISVTKTEDKRDGKKFYVSYLDIRNAKDGHSGKYECFIRSPGGRQTLSSFLHMQVSGKSDSVRCSTHPVYPGLQVTYSNGVSVGSVAIFSCSSPSRKLIGYSSSVCLDKGIWSNPAPSCEAKPWRDDSVTTVRTPTGVPPPTEVPNCSLDDLVMSLPENVYLDRASLDNDMHELIPTGSEVQLECVESVIDGDSKALCVGDGKWKLGNFQCVKGCLLDIDPSSKLQVEPMQTGYRLGDSFTLSCPPNYKLYPKVERMMCMSGTWSSALPECIEEI